MAYRTPSALLLSVLLGAALFLQVALADDAVAEAGHGDMFTASNFDFISTPEIDLDATVGADDVVDDQGDEESGEIQPYVYVPEADEVEADADDEDQASLEDDNILAHLLHGQKLSKDCWSEEKCIKFYSKADCCRNKCVNLATSNSNCGKCKKCCDTKRGYFCKSGMCRKRHSHVKTCNERTVCKGVTTCCRGTCVNVQQNGKNCGSCGSTCPFGSACCSGECRSLASDVNHCGKCDRKCPKSNECCLGVCISLKTSSNHCGKCGKSCRWGHKCCNGQCVSTISDKDNCGRCEKKCPKGVMCIYGICGYGH